MTTQYQNLILESAGLEFSKQLDKMSVMQLQQELSNIEAIQYHKEARGQSSFQYRGFNLSSQELSNVRLAVAESLAARASDDLVAAIDAEEPEQVDSRPIYAQELERIERELNMTPSDPELQEEWQRWTNVARNTEKAISDHEEKLQDRQDARDDMETATRIGLGIMD